MPAGRGATPALAPAGTESHGGEGSTPAREAVLSCLYGGIHVRTDNEVGLALGISVGEAVLAAWSSWLAPRR
jgi:hypothetical protein